MRNKVEETQDLMFDLAELKIAFAEKQGWTHDDYWWGDQEKAMEAERYAYEVLAKERAFTESSRKGTETATF